jgi:hypothetical protein
MAPAVKSGSGCLGSVPKATEVAGVEIAAVTIVCGLFLSLRRRAAEQRPADHVAEEDATCDAHGGLRRAGEKPATAIAPRLRSIVLIAVATALIALLRATVIAK